MAFENPDISRFGSLGQHSLPTWSRTLSSQDPQEALLEAQEVSSRVFRSTLFDFSCCLLLNVLHPNGLAALRAARPTGHGL